MLRSVWLMLFALAISSIAYARAFAAEGCCGHCAKCRHHGWIPAAGQIRTKKTPVKHVEKITVPSYRFVVEYVCPRCTQQEK